MANNDDLSVSEGEVYYVYKNLDFTLDASLLLNSTTSNTNEAQPGLIRYNRDTDKFEGFVANGREFVNGSQFVPMSLDVATSSELGGIKLGNNLSITADGKMNAVASSVSRKFQKILIVSQPLQENTDPESLEDGITTGDYRSINQCIIQYFGYDPNTNTFPNGELASIDKDQYPDPNANNKYMILITPGEYKEDQDLVDITQHQTIDIPPNVSLVGDDRDSCIINIKNLTSILMRNNTAIKNLTIDLTNANENINPSDPNEIIKAITILTNANNIIIENVAFKMSSCNINTTFIYSNTNNNVIIKNITAKCENLPVAVNGVNTSVEITGIKSTTSQIFLDSSDLYIESNKHIKNIIYADTLSAITVYNSKLEIKETNLLNSIQINNNAIQLVDSIFTCNYTSIKCTGYDNEFGVDANSIFNRGISVRSSLNYNNTQASQAVFIHNEANTTHDIIKVPDTAIDFSNYYINGSKIKITGTTNNNNVITTSYINTGTITEFGGSINASILGCDIASTLTDEEINNTSIIGFKELFQVNIFTSQITSDSEVIYFKNNDGDEAFNDNYYIQCSQSQLNGPNPYISDGVIVFDHNNEIIVGKEDANFNNVTDALNSITDASETNKYVVIIKPGTYLESQQLVIPEYVSLIGENTVIKFDSNSSKFPNNVAVIINSNISVRNIDFIFDKVQSVSANNIAIATSNYDVTNFETNITDETYFGTLNTITNVTLHNLKITIDDAFVNLNKLRSIIFIKMTDSIITNSRINLTHSYNAINELDAIIVYNKLTEINYNSVQVDITGTTSGVDYTVFKNDACNNNYNNPDMIINLTPSVNSSLRVVETNNEFESNNSNPNLSPYNTFIIGGTIRAYRNTNILPVEALFAEYNSTLIGASIIIEGDAKDRNNPDNDYPNSLLKTMSCFAVSRTGELISDITELSPDGGLTATSDSLHVGSYVGVADNIPFYNVLVGVRVATLNTTGTKNVMMGVDVANKQISGDNNVYLGYKVANNALESDNVFIGSNVASELITGSKNVFIGKDTGSNTNVVDNTVIIGHNTGKHIQNLAEGIIIGDSSMNMSDTATMSNIITIGSNGVGNNLVSSSKDIIMGSYTATNLENTSDSILLGHNTATDITDSSKSIIVGTNTGTSITTAENTIIIGNENMTSASGTAQTKNNLVIGNRALKNATTAKDNIVMGNGAGRNITTGARNVILGQEQYTAGNTTSPAKSLTTGNDSVIIGSNVATSVINGSRNFIIGNNSGNAIDSTSDNIILGYNSGSNISGGNPQDTQNIIIGNETGKQSSSGKVIMIGHEAGQNAIGVDSLIIGNRAGRTIAGPRNTIIGNKSAGISNDQSNPTLGQDNVLIGTFSGYELTTGSYNIVLGSGDGSNTAVVGTLDTAGAGYALQSGNRNFIAGFNAGRKLRSGSDNILLGNKAGAYLNQSGLNILIGNNAGLKLGSNDTVEANSENNVIIGNEAGENITLGNDLLFIGRGAGKNTTQGQQNTYIGNYSGQVNNGSRNTFIGNQTGYYNQGENNTMVGVDAGYNSETASFNTFIGYNSGRGPIASKNNGDYNTAIGYQAGQEITNGYRNLYLGHQAGRNNTDGAKNIMIGPNAGLNSTGSKSIFIGAAESNTGGVGLNATGELNVLIGPETGVAMTSGGRNVCIGSYTGQHMTTAGSSVLIGADAGQNITTGDKNVLLGPGTGQNIISGTNNIMLGDRAGTNAQNGASENILIGTLAGSAVEIDNSINIGNKAGQNNVSGVGNILIGRHAGQKFEQSRNNIMIGSNAGANFYPSGSNITLGENIYIGPEVGRDNVSGLRNIVIGSEAFKSSVQGSGVIAIGYKAGASAGVLAENVGGNTYDNTIIGFEAGSQGDYGRRNVMIGAQSGRNVNNARKFEGNVLLGSEAGKNSNLSINSVVLGSANKVGSGGVNNVIAGTNAGENLGVVQEYEVQLMEDLQVNQNSIKINNITYNVVAEKFKTGDTILIDDGTNSFETSISSIELYSYLADQYTTIVLNSSYTGDVAISTGATITLLSKIDTEVLGFYDSSKSSSNTLLGNKSAYNLKTGSKNVSLGDNSLHENTIGKYNNILGTESGYKIKTDNNTCFGTKAGYSIDEFIGDTSESKTYHGFTILDNSIILYNNSDDTIVGSYGTTLDNYFQPGDIIDIENTTSNKGRYKIESTVGNVINIEGYPKIEEIKVPENINPDSLIVNAVNYNFNNVTINDGGTKTITVSKDVYSSGVYYPKITANFVFGLGYYVDGVYEITISGSKYNDGTYYLYKDGTALDESRIRTSATLYPETFDSNVNIVSKSINVENNITEGNDFKDIMANAPLFAFLGASKGLYRASNNESKYLVTKSNNKGVLVNDILLEQDGILNTVFTEGLHETLNIDMNEYIRKDTYYLYGTIRITLNSQDKIYISSGIALPITDVNDYYRISGTQYNNILVKITKDNYANGLYYSAEAITGNFVNETINSTVSSPVKFTLYQIKSLQNDVNKYLSSGSIINMNLSHTTGQNLIDGSYLVDYTFDSTNRAISLADNQVIPNIYNKNGINDTQIRNVWNYNETIDPELLINKEIYTVDNDYLIDTANHINGYDLMFQTGNIAIDSGLYLHSSNNHITTSVKYGYKDLLAPCMIKLDSNYYLVKSNKYPFQKLEIDVGHSTISDGWSTSNTIYYHTVSTYQNSTNLAIMEQGTTYKLFGGNNNHIVDVVPVSNSTAISRESVYLTDNSLISNYQGNNKLIILESRHDDYAMPTQGPSEGYGRGYFKHLEINNANVDITFDYINTEFEPIRLVSPSAIKFNEFIIIPDKTLDTKYNLIKTKKTNEFIDVSSLTPIDTFNGSSIYNDITTLTSAFTIYDETVTELKINTYGFLSLQTDNNIYSINFLTRYFDINYIDNTDVNASIKTYYLSTDGNTNNVLLIDFVCDVDGIIGYNNCQIRLYLNNSNVKDIGKIYIEYSNISDSHNVLIGIDTTNTKVKNERISTLLTDNYINSPMQNINDDTIDDLNNKKILLNYANRTLDLNETILQSTDNPTQNYFNTCSVYGDVIVVGDTMNNVVYFYNKDDLSTYYDTITPSDSTTLYGINLQINDTYLSICSEDGIYLYKYNESDVPATEIKLTHALNDTAATFGATWLNHKTNNTEEDFTVNNISLFNNKVAIGRSQWGTSNAGAYIYTLNTFNYTSVLNSEVKINATSGIVNSYAKSLYLHNNYLAVGATYYNDVYLYNLNTSPVSSSELIFSNGISASTRWGYDIAMNDNYFAIIANEEQYFKLYDYSTYDQTTINNSNISIDTTALGAVLSGGFKNYISIYNNLLVSQVFRYDPGNSYLHNLLIYDITSFDKVTIESTEIIHDILTTTDTNIMSNIDISNIGFNTDIDYNTIVCSGIIDISSSSNVGNVHVLNTQLNNPLDQYYEISINTLQSSDINSEYSNAAAFTTLTGNSYTLTSIDSSIQFTDTSNLTINRNGYIKYEDTSHEYYLNVYNHTSGWENVYYAIENTYELYVVYEDTSTNTLAQALIYLNDPSNINTGTVELCYSNINLLGSNIASIGINANYLVDYLGNDINENNSIIYFNDLLNVAGIEYISNNDIIKIENSSNNNTFYQVSNIATLTDNYLTLVDNKFAIGEYESNINIIINQYTAYDEQASTARVDFQKIRQYSGEHSDFLRFLKLRQPDLRTEYKTNDMTTDSYDDISFMDKGLNLSVDTNIFDTDGTFTANIATTYVIPFKETVPNEYLGSGSSNANARSDYYAIALGEPVFEATNNEEEIRNINTSPKGFTDIFMNDGDESVIYNSQKTGYVTSGIYTITPSNITITSNLDQTNSYYQIDTISGSKQRIPNKPFLDLKPGNIIHLTKNSLNINSTINDSSYLITKVYDSGLKVDYDPLYNSSNTSGSYSELDTFKIDICNLDVSSSYKKGQLVNERYNFANFTAVNSIPTVSDKLRTGTRQYIAVSQYPILNYELNPDNSTVKNFENYMIPDWGFKPTTSGITEYDTSNVLVTMDFFYDGQLNHDPIILDKGSHMLVVPTSNISETITSTNIFFIDSSETGEYTVETTLGDNNIFLLTTSPSSGIDFTNFVNNQVLYDAPYGFYFKVKSSSTYSITQTQLPCDRNYVNSSKVFITVTPTFKTFTSTLQSNAIMSSNSSETDLSIFKPNNRIIVTNTSLNNNTYIITNINPTAECILLNTVYSSVVDENPELCTITNVILQKEYGNVSYSGSQVHFDPTTNSIKLQSTPTNTTNMQNFTKNQQIVVYDTGNNNQTFTTSDEYPTSTEIPVTISPYNENTTGASIYKKIIFNFVGHPVRTVLNNVNALFHYGDAQGNNMMLGSFTGQFCGSKNLAIHNTYIGNKVGQTNHGSGNMFFGNETGLATRATDGESYYNNKFAIYKNNFIGVPDKPLIGGDFGSGRVGINTINPDSLLTSSLETPTKLIVNGAVRASSHSTFTGTHIITISEDTDKSQLKPGMILSSTGKVNKLNIIDTVVECEITSTEKDKKVFGIYASNENVDGETVYYAAGVGEGQIWVSNIAGNVEAGDYVCSSPIAGYTQLQDDDLAHNYTVAKVTEDINWNSQQIYSLYNNNTYKVALVSCVYMCS